MLTYADVCRRAVRKMVQAVWQIDIISASAYADVCCRMLTCADVC